MKNIWKFLILFLALVIYKFITNYIAYKKCHKFAQRHFDWVMKKDAAFPTFRSEVIALFKRANITDAHVTITRSLLPGHLQSANVSVFDNFPSIYTEVIAIAQSMFDDAIGVYRRRILDSINPLYWIDLVVFAPRHLLHYLGIDTERATAKICNLILSILWWIFCIGLAFFKQFIQLAISNFFKIPL